MRGINRNALAIGKGKIGGKKLGINSKAMVLGRHPSSGKRGRTFDSVGVSDNHTGIVLSSTGRIGPSGVS